MIRQKNLADTVLVLKSTLNTAVTAIAFDVASVPFDGFISAISASIGTQGTDGTGAPTQDLKVDIKKNGTSIFAGAALIGWLHARFAGTANTPLTADSYGALAATPLAVKEGDLLALSVAQLVNGTNPVQPQNITVRIVISKKSTSPRFGSGSLE
jgi:hypothetical protein